MKKINIASPYRPYGLSEKKTCPECGAIFTTTAKNKYCSKCEAKIRRIMKWGFKSE